METSKTPVGLLLAVVFNSILEVFLLCLSGYILAGRSILDKKTQKQINRLNVSLFTPALLFSKVAFFLTPAKLRELWIIPMFFVLVTVTSMTVAFLLGTLFGLKKSQRSFAMAAAMFMNSNSLPIALMQSLVVTVPGLMWDKDDNKNAMLGRALTYLVLYSTLGMVLRWSYGVKLLSQADDEIQCSPVIDERSPLLSSFNGHTTDNAPLSGSPSNAVGSLITNSANETDNSPKVGGGEPKPNFLRLPQRRRTTFYNSFPNSPTRSRTDLPNVDSESSSGVPSVAASPDGSDVERDDDERGSHGRNLALPTHYRTSETARSHQTGFQRFVRHTKRQLIRVWLGFSDFMTAPLWAAAASLVVACMPSLQRALEDDIRPVNGAISSAGKCSIPLTLIVLGAYFYPMPNDGEQNRGQKSTKSSKSVMGRLKAWIASTRSDQEPARQKRHGETKTVVIAVVSRMIVTPVILLPLMALSAKFDIHNVFSDPVFVVAYVLLISSPPALTLAQITQAASGDAFERLISRTIFWSYCIVTPPMTIVCVVIGLILAKL
ncbi:hypothetical protein AX17_004667 [Amanita inopinata Kibby_2008]|nr:hypothetical protein AX17_004667 [Amanita inopinata Kibby_2008]